MKKCEFQGEQEKCPNYKMKDEKKRDFTCLYFRRDFPEKDYCFCNGEYHLRGEKGGD